MKRKTSYSPWNPSLAAQSSGDLKILIHEVQTLLIFVHEEILAVDCFHCHSQLLTVEGITCVEGSSSNCCQFYFSCITLILSSQVIHCKYMIEEQHLVTLEMEVNLLSSSPTSPSPLALSILALVHLPLPLFQTRQTRDTLDRLTRNLRPGEEP